MLWVVGSSLLWVAAACIGFGYGGLWGVQPTIIGELFGMNDFSFKYSCSMASAAIGTVLFNEGIAGPIFDKNSEGRPEFPKCFSSVCFNTTFLVAIAACIPA